MWCTVQGQKKVTWNQGGESHSGVFDTVLLATGRTPCTSNIGLAAAGVELSASGKVRLGRRDVYARSSAEAT